MYGDLFKPFWESRQTEPVKNSQTLTTTYILIGLSQITVEYQIDSTDNE